MWQYVPKVMTTWRNRFCVGWDGRSVIRMLPDRSLCDRTISLRNGADQMPTTPTVMRELIPPSAIECVAECIHVKSSSWQCGPALCIKKSGGRSPSTTDLILESARATSSSSFSVAMAPKQVGCKFLKALSCAQSASTTSIGLKKNQQHSRSNVLMGLTICPE